MSQKKKKVVLNEKGNPVEPKGIDFKSAAEKLNIAAMEAEKNIRQTDKKKIDELLVKFYQNTMPAIQKILSKYQMTYEHDRAIIQTAKASAELRLLNNKAQMAVSFSDIKPIVDPKADKKAKKTKK